MSDDRFVQNLSRSVHRARPWPPGKEVPLSALPCHYGIEPSGKEAPLLEHADQGHEVSSDITPLIPCFFADVIGHPIQLLRGAVWWCPAVPPRPLSSTAGVRAFSRRIFAEVMRLKVDLLQAVPRPILAEVHPREVGILSVIIDDPKASKLPRSVKNGRRRAIFRRRRAAPRHAPDRRPSRGGARPASDALISLVCRDAVTVRARPSRAMHVPGWTREEPHYSPRLKSAHQIETHCSCA